MSIRDYTAVTVSIPIRMMDEAGQDKVMFAEIAVERDRGTAITIPGAKNANMLLEMLLRQQLDGFAMIQKPAQQGFPPDTVEVVHAKHQVSPVVTGYCDDHSPVQHRDGKQPWCDACGLNYVGATPTGALRIGDSVRQAFER